VAVCSNERIQALKLELPPEMAALCDNVVPHITLSHLPEVKPVESNNMIQSEHIVNPISCEIDLIIETLEFR
jgi:hypothetical protein